MNMLKHFNKLITHNATFHADEVFAIALLWQAGYVFQLERTREKEIIAEALANSKTLVLDVGMSYNSEMNNFDHHQDADLFSAAGLIWNHIKYDFCKPELHVYLDPFFYAIDAMDTNRNLIYHEWEKLPKGFRNVSSIIAGYNRDPENDVKQRSQFLKALHIAEEIIGNELHNAEKKHTSELAYKSREILPNNVAVFDEFNSVWKDKKDHVFAVMPHATGWQIQSIDKSIDLVPESIADVEGFVFRHISGFMGVVKEKHQAIKFARSLPIHLLLP